MQRQDPAHTGFGDLPRELRDQIYAEIVAVDETAVRNVHTQVVTSHSGVMVANRCINTEYNEALQKAQSTRAVLHHPHVYDHRPRSAHELYLLSRWALREAAWVPGDVTRVLMTVHINGSKFASSSDGNPIASIESPDIRRLITRILKDLLTRFFLEHVVIKIELSNAELNWHSRDRMVDVIEEVNSIIQGTMNTPLRAVGVVLPGHAGFFLERDYEKQALVYRLGEESGWDALMQTVRATTTTSRSAQDRPALDQAGYTAVPAKQTNTEHS